ncbi:FAD-dependent oxidoreductase [Nocardioides sp. MAHUQ-72]|uniref:FAD-dependent oxidoreductase n=1 Tax=unclassified Nocardioides TaxID=2615069 RepID=UPI00360FB3DF
MTLTSLWRDRAARTTPAAIELDGHWDALVVGAGITGLTTALLLARAGCSVAVVEAREVGAGTTGGSTAKVSVLQGTQLSRLARRQSDAAVEQYVAANTEASAWVDRYCAEHGVALQKRPAYTYATTARGEQAARAELAVAQRAGLPVAWTETPELPFATRGAVRLPDQVQLDPMELLLALAADLEAHGGTLVEGARVRRVTGRHPVTVTSDRGSATADSVVVATNMPVLDRGGFFARASAQRSYCLAFSGARPTVQGMYLSADSPTRSLRDAPGPDGPLLLVGGNGHGTGRSASPQAKVDDLLAWTHEHFPGVELTHTWSAQDYVTSHALPFVGPLVPGRDDLLVAGGYAKWGMTNGVAAALALSSRLLGGHTEWAAVLDSWSPAWLRGAPQAALLNGEVGWEMARGWLAPLTHRGGRAPEEGRGEVRVDHLGPPTAVSTVDGVVRRVSAVCPHLGGVLRWNDAEHSWDCPLHGSRFDKDGELLEGPATCGLRRVAD